jgi:hypothetical protein
MAQRLEIEGSVLVRCTEANEKGNVTVPLGVREVADGAFAGLSRLRDVALPQGIEKIGVDAFSESAIRSIRIPDSVRKIGRNAFFKCGALKAVHLPDALEAIEEFTFTLCLSLEDAPIPKRVKRIGAHAFLSCEKLEAVVLPDFLEEIGDYAFSNCFSVKEVAIPRGAKVGAFAFKGCASLEEASFGRVPGGEGPKVGEGVFQDTPYARKWNAKGLCYVCKQPVGIGGKCPSCGVDNHA